MNSPLDLRQLTQVILDIIHEELDFQRGTVFVVGGHEESAAVEMAKMDTVNRG